ncbi:MFS general substrate transporter [Calocera viscosa TUFC12733]|uniref:MFS general substrate transporter n=1 Tax=Calocera viscosa (strain TUFC12733) TaxID=1330018 RepID=A0A167RHZ1_CALVF|nr:MFS general substrate transporter [Calocera viscosa TUFC12733]
MSTKRPHHQHFRSPTQVALLSSIDTSTPPDSPTTSRPGEGESSAAYSPPPAYTSASEPHPSGEGKHPHYSPEPGTPAPSYPPSPIVLRTLRPSKHSAHQRVKEEGALGPDELSPRRTALIMTLLYIATLFYGIDSTVVATLATPIASGFQQLNRAAWLNSAYLLSVACCTPIYGKLSDVLGRRAAVVSGLLLFAAGSALCGVAGGMNTLIVARLIQGAGGGGSGMLGSIIISDVVTLRTRGLLNGVGSVCWAVGAGLGGVYGGVVADTLGWRWAFLLQVPPLVLIMFGLALSVNYVVPGQTGSWETVSKRIDWAGSGLLITGIGALVLAIAFKTNEDLPFSHPWVWGTGSLAIISITAFFVVEKKFAIEPVIELACFNSFARVAMFSSVFLAGSATISLGLFFPMLLQIVRGNSASVAGLHLIPNTVASAFGGVSSGIYLRTVGKYRTLLFGLGILQFVPCFLLSTFGAGTWEGLTWVVLMPQRFGSSGFSGTIFIAILSTIKRTEIAQITSMRFLSQSLGNLIGMALSSAVQQSVLSTELTRRISGSDAQMVISEVRRNATAILDLSPALRAASILSYTASLRAVFLLNGGLAIGAASLVWFVKEIPLTDRAEMEDAEYKLAAGDDDSSDAEGSEEEEEEDTL